MITSKSAGGSVPFFIGFAFRCSFQPANAGDAPRAREICVLVFEYYIISRRLCFESIESAVYSYSLFVRYAHSPVHSYGPSIVVILYQVYPASSSVWFMTDCSLFDGVLFSVTIYALTYSSVAVNR